MSEPQVPAWHFMASWYVIDEELAQRVARMLRGAERQRRRLAWAKAHPKKRRRRKP